MRAGRSATTVGAGSLSRFKGLALRFVATSCRSGRRRWPTRAGTQLHKAFSRRKSGRRTMRALLNVRCAGNRSTMVCNRSWPGSSIMVNLRLTLRGEPRSIRVCPDWDTDGPRLLPFKMREAATHPSRNRSFAGGRPRPELYKRARAAPPISRPASAAETQSEAD